MSLYNNVAGKLSSSGFLGAAESAIGGGIDALAGSAAQALGGGALATSVTNTVASVAKTAASEAIDRALPPEVQRAINGGASVVSDVLAGDWQGALTGALDLGMDLLDKGNDRFWSSANPLYGGLSPSEARQICTEVAQTGRAKKNLFLIKVSSALQGDFSQQFNLFCVDIEHNPFAISGDKARIGAAFVDLPNASEPDEMRITTLDDRRGSLKLWFEAHAAAIAARDGTIGVPGQYAIKFEIVHAFAGDLGGFKAKGLYRATSYDVALSRREDALEEISMTFTQIDTFVEP
ncbi:MAG: hypothetical protein ACRCYV_02480 [Aeromonas sp.]